MINIRQLTIKGDPMVRVQLPKVVIQMLRVTARKNKRRTQDQFIKSLAETFKHENTFVQSVEKFLPDLKEVYKSQQGKKNV